MGDRNQVRDRTLILRVLDPSLQTALRDKMAAAQKAVSQRAADAAAALRLQQQQNPSLAIVPHYASSQGGSNSSSSKEGTIVDLDGVSCEPTEDGSTLWHFHCDGATYPARLSNLPNPIELHKTYDHNMYYKSCDVGQILIVYEDQTAMDEAESTPGFKTEGFPSFYHSGVTPPMKRVVERRFAEREHKNVPPPKDEVTEVERELGVLIDMISRDTKPSKSKKATPSKISIGTASGHDRVLEEVVEEVVEYEPWMDDNGRQPYGVEFDEKDPMCMKHPEVWLDPADAKKAIAECTGVTPGGSDYPTGSEKGLGSTSSGGNSKKKDKEKKKKPSSSDGGRPSSPVPPGSSKKRQHQQKRIYQKEKLQIQEG
uniref:TAFII55 protein conserved region domain-containing protein n=1 Tax=Ditylum brightwellii TaxID=49249 RepID=A0A7S4SFM2_9STRA